jgi:uncharacterized protein (TIGR03437 family)
MGAAWCLAVVLAAATLLRAEGGGSRQAPTYSVASIVNAASNAVGALAPNTFATIYGSNLSYATRAMAPEDISGGRLPTELGGVRVVIDTIPAVIYYVSPGQINLLIPYILVMMRDEKCDMSQRPEAELQLTLDGKAGPAVSIKLLEAAPALFQSGAGTVVATRADWSAVTEAAPARPGEVVVLFATGLGCVVLQPDYLQAPQGAAALQRLNEFSVLLDGAPLDASRILYAGVAPGFAGLYQINLKLPEKLGDNPEIRVAVGSALGSQTSPAGLRLPVRAAAGAQPATLGAR